MVRTLVAFWLGFASAAGAKAQTLAGPFAPALARADLDPAAFRQWVGGLESAAPDGVGPAQLVWTDDAAGSNEPRWNGVRFGAGPKPGPRHLRVGFTNSHRVGTVLTAGPVRVSVLKPAAAYPGDLSDEAQWVPVERLDGGRITAAQARDHQVAVWVLPPNTATRAVRFSHDADAADKAYDAALADVTVLADRLANVAPQAAASASANGQHAPKLNNESVDGIWGAWHNFDDKAPPPAVADAPPSVVLTWPTAVPLRGLATLWSGFAAATVDAYTGPADRHPKEARPADWTPVFAGDRFQSRYPHTLAPQGIDFGKTVTTRAVRVRLTKVTAEGHPHLKGNTKDGRRVWLGDLFALRDLGAAPLAAALPDAPAAGPHPPIPVRFTLAEPGVVTLVIDDAAGKRVRNLVSETPFPAGDNVAWWDGLDDRGRDPEAARRGVYSVPGTFVAPGTYRVRGLVGLRYEFPVYSEGHPAWQTADHTGGWLSNHSPPSAALFVPAGRGPGGKAAVYLGSFVSEGTHGLAWVDTDGKKLGGVNWVGGVWTGAPNLARDDGPDAVPGVACYAAVAWEADKKKRLAEVRVTAVLAAGGERAALRHRYELSPAAVKPGGDFDLLDEVGGVAARNGFVFVALRRQNKVLVIDARKADAKASDKTPSGTAVGELPLADPRGLGFDAAGKLLALSGRTLVRLTPPAEAGKPAAWPAPETVVAAGPPPPRPGRPPRGPPPTRAAGPPPPPRSNSPSARTVRCTSRIGARRTR